MARYELLERIGVGGMAEIFRGIAVAGGGFEKPVAIKRILPHLSQDNRFVELLIAEAKILSELRHRNIVQIYDVGLGDDGQYFLVMEFVDGRDLGALYDVMEKRGQRIPLEVALYIVAETCQALDHVHGACAEDGSPLGLVHRDVSPSNVMLSRSGEVKLTDFGIAKRMEEATGHGGVRGKFAYISPEQAHNAHVDARSDVYSAGILLFELALGQRLFSGLPDFDALRAVRANAVPSLREIDPAIDPRLEQLLSRALSADPGERFETAGRFGAELRGLRYSLESGIADPAAAIAELLIEDDREAARVAGAGDFEQERTVVRINTAVGFSLTGIQHLGEALAHASELAGDETEDRMLEEKTHAMSIEQLSDAIGGGGSSRASLMADESGDVTTDNVSVGDDTNAATRVADFAGMRAAMGATSRPRPPSRPGDHLLRQPRTEPAPESLLQRHDPGPGANAPAQLARPATPTVREVFHSGYMAGPAMPGVQQPGYPPQMASSPVRGRATMIASGLAVVLAIVSFVLVGQLLGDDDATAAGAVSVDAGLSDASVDAAAPTLEMPPDRVDEAPAERKQRRQRQRRKRGKRSRR